MQVKTAARRGCQEGPPCWLRDISRFSPGYACPEPGLAPLRRSTALWFMFVHGIMLKFCKANGFEATCFFLPFLRNAQKTVRPLCFWSRSKFPGDSFSAMGQRGAAWGGRQRCSRSGSWPGLSPQTRMRRLYRVFGSVETLGHLSCVAGHQEFMGQQNQTENKTENKTLGNQPRIQIQMS